ncbi:hypothetical protein [Pseudoalteromonas sp. UCD-33C]|uniref:hypothetical protein n=1 Tax=Pseudoalteromonas sp. UCD-33C TaxID=1716175 RepID=UPI0006CA36A9|nr:hypothetical protein [Pseudoalteromonas sp. UCD-33C]KPM75458.1 hypothetical protein AOG26_16855 [Pseudoalteromonas sp. UCD-33C]
MKLLIEFTLFFLVVFNAFLINKRDFRLALVSSLFYLFISDYLLYKVGYGLGELSVGKLYIELVFILLLVFFLNTLMKQHFKLDIVNSPYVLLLPLSLTFFAIGAFNNGIVQAVNGWRSIFLFVFFSWLIFIGLNSAERKVLFKVFLKTLVLICVLNSLYSIYEYLNFDGSYSNIWRYNLLLEAKVAQDSSFNERFLQYQLVRGESLRASGFFVSALASSFFTAFVAILITNVIVNTKFSYLHVVYVGILILLLLSMYFSQVRTSIVLYIFALTFSFSSKFKRLSPSLFLVYIFTLPLIFFVLAILNQSSLDASSAGRILQYNYLFSNFSILGQGLGGNVGKFDSFYIYTYADLGLGAVLLLLFFYSLYKKIPVSYGQSSRYERDGMPILQSAFIAFFPVLSVQHVAGSLYYFSVLFLLAALVMDNKEYIKNR